MKNNQSVTNRLSRCAMCGEEISGRAKTCSDTCRKRLSRTQTRDDLGRIRQSLRAIRRATDARPELGAETVVALKGIQEEIRDLLMHLKDAEESARREMMIQHSTRRLWV